MEVILPNFCTELDFPYVTKILIKDFQNQSYHEWAYCVIFLYTHLCALYYVFVCAEMEGSESLENLRSLAMQGDDRSRSKKLISELLTVPIAIILLLCSSLFWLISLGASAFIIV